MTILALLLASVLNNNANCSTAMKLDGVAVTSCAGRIVLRSDGVIARRYYANGEITETTLETGATRQIVEGR